MKCNRNFNIKYILWCNNLFKFKLVILYIFIIYKFISALQDQTDQTLGDAQNQLTQSESELNKVLDRNKTIERQKLQLENQIKDLEKEINNFKVNMTHLDHEKDQLLVSNS